MALPVTAAGRISPRGAGGIRWLLPGTASLASSRPVGLREVVSAIHLRCIVVKTVSVLRSYFIGRQERRRKPRSYEPPARTDSGKGLKRQTECSSQGQLHFTRRKIRYPYQKTFRAEHDSTTAH